MLNEKKYIGYIQNGVNLDHIPCGNVWSIIKIVIFTIKQVWD